METLNILGTYYSIFGKHKGSNDNKFNRAAKLAHLFNKLEDKFTVPVATGNVHTTGFNESLAVLMLMHTGIRVGNEDSAEGYMTNPHPNQPDKVSEFVQTYGLTTLKPEHFVDKGTHIDVLFLGKKCVDNSFTITHPVILSGLRHLLAVSQPDKYLLGIKDSELTKFIKMNVGEQFSPKDFRCLKANLLAWQYITTIPEMFLNKTYHKHQVGAMYRYVSNMLNNTPGVCKKNYVSPEILPYMEMLFK